MRLLLITVITAIKETKTALITLYITKIFANYTKIHKKFITDFLYSILYSKLNYGCNIFTISLNRNLQNLSGVIKDLDSWGNKIKDKKWILR